ncbi:MAG TPA: glycosyl hydrolase 53 family protein [Polyangiaceae bacterium]|nr:glycosyl hydrolase 53 family protein [Polyangiaceae bacterium]
MAAATLALSSCAAIERSSSDFAAGGRGAGGTGTAGAASHRPAAGSGGDPSTVAGAEGGSAGSEAAPSSSASFIIGADITWVQADEAQGAKYSDGTRADILQILKRHGFNYIRLRTFVDPKATDGYDKQNGFADLAHTIAFGKRIKAAGLGFLLDFHYSDNWADPRKQCVPVGWQSLPDIESVANALHEYTLDAVGKLVDAGARPDMVQIGNEIAPGMDIHVCDQNGNPKSVNPVAGAVSNWSNLGALLRAGSDAVKQVDPDILVMLHLHTGDSFEASRDFIDHAHEEGVSFEVFGASCYTTYQGPPANWRDTFSRLATTYPALKLVIAEYGPEQRAANDLLFALPGAQGLGSFVWEPTHSGDWNKDHSLFTLDGNTFAATADLSLYDEMAVAYASRL